MTATVIFEDRTIDVMALCRAAKDMLALISTITTEEFEYDKDRDVRIALAKALGLDPDAYAL